MTTRGKITTSGFEEYLEKLAKAGRNIDAVAARALQAGGEVALEGMQKRVAEDTGNLKDTLRIVGPKQEGNYVFILVGLVNADGETTRYGNAQEYGSSSMPAHPYVRPTMDEDKVKIRKAMKIVFEEEVGK